MNSIAVFLLALTLNAQTGQELSRKMVTDRPHVFTSLNACTTEQRKTEVQKPINGRITVYQCAVITGTKKTS